MNNDKSDLSKFENKPLGSSSYLKKVIWYLTNQVFFNSYFFPFYRLKTLILKLFGAKVGKNIVIKPNVNIKYPWNLEIGNNSWIGEGVWIDNLDEVFIGSNVCISQGVKIVTGNHNYKKTSFDLFTKPVVVDNGAWLCAKSIISPGVRIGSHSILSVGSVALTDLEPFSIYRGNPAVFFKRRVFEKK